MANVKYHISPVTGNPAVCSASKRPCPLGENVEHYSSKIEARAAFEGKMFQISFHGEKAVTLSDMIEFRESEVNHLRDKKETASPFEIKVLNGQIRGKSITITKMKKELRDSDIKLAGTFFDKSVAGTWGPDISDDDLEFQRSQYVAAALANSKALEELREMKQELLGE